MREEIERQGGIKLIYIGPPFDVGADFSMDIEISDETFTKKPNILEEIAYRDTRGKGADSFITMLYERLLLMHDLIAANGSICVHCDWRVNSINLPPRSSSCPGQRKGKSSAASCRRSRSGRSCS